MVSEWFLIIFIRRIIVERKLQVALVNAFAIFIIFISCGNTEVLQYILARFLRKRSKRLCLKLLCMPMVAVATMAVRP